MEDFQYGGFFATLMKDAMEKMDYWNAKKEIDDLLAVGMEFKDKRFINHIVTVAMYALLYSIN